jgi:hypothetical protein
MKTSYKKLFLAVSVGLLIAGIAVITLSRAQVVSINQLASDSKNDPELDAALVAVLDNPACPQDSDQIPEFVQDYFPLMFPDLALRERRKDPAFVQAEAAANALMADPGSIRAELMKDPAFPAREQAVANQIAQWNEFAAGLQQQVLEDEVAAWRAKHPRTSSGVAGGSADPTP